MSIADVRPFFRAKFEALGFEEHRDSLEAPENIGSTELERVFHMGISDINTLSPSHQGKEFVYPVPITLMVNGFNDEASALDESDSIITTVLCSVLAAATRSDADIFDIDVGLIEKKALSDENDNVLRIVFNFTARIFDEF